MLKSGGMTSMLEHEAYRCTIGSSAAYDIFVLNVVSIVRKE